MGQDSSLANVKPAVSSSSPSLTSTEAQSVASPNYPDGYVPRRKLSLADLMSRTRLDGESGRFSGRYVFNSSSPAANAFTVGDIVSVPMYDRVREGIIIEKVNRVKVRIDFGEYIKECLVESCTLVIRSYEFEVGDKVEAKPRNSNLFFVGKVITVHEDKSVDVLMDGDDPDDVEYNIPAEDVRKLMSRRSVVVNRWKRAFMMVVAANFFMRIALRPNSEQKETQEESSPA